MTRLRLQSVFLSGLCDRERVRAAIYAAHTFLSGLCDRELLVQIILDAARFLSGLCDRELAALAALADSPSRLSGIAHLRGHETDRLAAIASEITKLGGACVETRDGLKRCCVDGPASTSPLAC